jgi:hypothetical protein
MPQATATATKQSQHVEQNLRALMCSLKLRSHLDGTPYRAVDLDDPNYGTLTDIIRELHEDELPNDWRFNILYDITSALLEQTEYLPEPESIDDLREYCWQLADDLKDYTHYALAQWVSDKPARAEWRDDEIAPDNSDIMDLIQTRQREEIEWMAVTLLDHMELCKLY